MFLVRGKLLKRRGGRLMTVELIKDLLKIDQTVGRDQIQALVEGEIFVPQTKPDINKILTVDADVEITGTKIVQDKIIVSGTVNFKVLYKADDERQSVHSLDASNDFRKEVEIEGINEKMSADIKANVEHIDYKLLENNKISVKTVLEIEGKVQSDNNINIVKDIKGSEGLQILKESIKYNDIIAANNSSTLVKEAFEIQDDMPDIVDILRVDLKAYERETKVVDDKVIVAGVVVCSIMYFGDDEDNKINYLSHEIPFTHFVETTGALKDMNCNIRLQASNPDYDIKEDINGDIRIIDVEAMVKIDAKIYEQREKEVTVDTYSTKKKFNVKKQEVIVTENIGENISKEIVKGLLNISGEDDTIKNIYNLNAKPILTDYRIVEDKIIIEGLLVADMLYLSGTDNEIKGIKQEIPFKTYVDADGLSEDMEIDVENILEDISYNQVDNQEVEIEAIVKNVVSINRIKKINIVTEAEEVDEEIDRKSRPSITIYIVQKDDTLWDIAKRYNTTVEELISTNDILAPENIMPGEKIIIEKHVHVEI